MTDEELIAAVQQGDADAWGVLYRRWLPWVWRCAYSLVEDVHAAEDVTSDVMMAWVRQVRDTGRDAPQLAGWLRQVIRHKAVDHHRRGERNRRVANEVGLRQQESCNTDDPSELLELSESRADVRKALDQLNEPQRLMLEWKYAEGLSVREIALRLGTTPKAVEASLYRGRQELRRHLQPLEEHASRRAKSRADVDSQASTSRSELDP